MNLESRYDQSGMSLVELLVALAVVGLTLSLAVMAISPREEALRTTVRNLRYDLELARYTAISRNTAIFVEIDMEPGTKAYTVYLEDPDDGRVLIKPAVSLERLRVFSGVGAGVSELAEPLELQFSGFGGSTPITLTFASGVERRRATGYACWVASYRVELSATGRVNLQDDIEPKWMDKEYCDHF